MLVSLKQVVLPAQPGHLEDITSERPLMIFAGTLGMANSGRASHYPGPAPRVLRKTPVSCPLCNLALDVADRDACTPQIATLAATLPLPQKRDYCMRMADCMDAAKKPPHELVHSLLVAGLLSRCTVNSHNVSQRLSSRRGQLSVLLIMPPFPPLGGNIKSRKHIFHQQKLTLHHALALALQLSA